MRKFIIAICGVFVVGGAIGASRVPDKKDFDWGQNEVFDKDVSSTFTKKEYFGHADGTYGNDEGAIVAFVARKIYKNGGYFCATQIQAANENMNDHSWIDYYRNSFPCETVCKPGFAGDECETNISGTNNYECNNDDFTKGTFRSSLLDLLKKDGKSVGRFTEEMQVLDYEHGYGTSDYNRAAWDTVLGVLEVKQHGIVVAPVKVQGVRAGSWGAYISYMVNASTTKNSFLLCAEGYVKQEDDCVALPKCKQEQEDAENSQIPMCTGYGYYDETQHTMKMHNGCRYYRCKNSGYGFQEGTNHKCVACGDAKKSGVLDNGACKVCDTGWFFDKSVDGGCKRGKAVPKEKMRNCFMKTDQDEFEQCVNND